MLAISPRTLRRYIADGQVPTCRLPSGRVRIREAAIAALMMGEEGTSAGTSTRRRDVPPPTAGPHDSASRRARRLPLGERHPPALDFDTSPKALEEARAACA
jgi:hypothetical protein